MHIALISPRKKRNNLKTHANSIESSIISNLFLKTHAYSMLLEKITLKPMRIAMKMIRRNQPPERRTSLQDSLQRWKFLASRAHAASPRPLARTTRTRNETETDFPVGGPDGFFPPNLRSHS